MAKIRRRNKHLGFCLYRFWQIFIQKDDNKVLTVFNLGNVKILVLETLKTKLRAKIAQGPSIIGRRGLEEISRVCVLELEIDGQGRIIYYPVKYVRFDSRRTMPPPEIPKELVSLNRNQPWESYYWQISGNESA